MKRINVHRAVTDLFNPEKNPPTPLIRIDDHPYPDILELWLKALHLGASPSGKSITAYGMVKQADREGRICGKDVIIPSSGNFLAAAAIMAFAYGAKSVRGVLPNDTLRSKIVQCRLLTRQEPILTPLSVAETKYLKIDISHLGKDQTEMSSFEVVSALGKLKNSSVLDQYSDPENPKAHARYTACQMFDQMNGGIDIIAAGLGTGGTAVGMRQYVGIIRSSATVLGVGVLPDEKIQGLRTKKRLAETHQPWKTAIHHYVEVGNALALEHSYTYGVCRGNMAGPSTGANIEGLFQFIIKARESRKFWASLTDGRKKAVGVVVGMDGSSLYNDEYLLRYAQ